jgi:hypothetical protein
MPLFLDRLPLHRWTDQTRTPPLEYWSVVFPVLVTESGLNAPPSGTPQQWVCDTGNNGEAFAWRRHLEAAGLDPDVRQSFRQVRAVVPGGRQLILPVREADLWLVSNVAAYQGAPHPLRLDRGVSFIDLPTIPDPNLNRPLIGMRALRRARLRVELDFGAGAVSVWVP